MFSIKFSLNSRICRQPLASALASVSASCYVSRKSQSRKIPAIIRFMSSSPVMEASSKKDSRFALILGKPGGGKGTISKKILKDFPQFKHISSGDILREHVRHETKIGLQAIKYMKEGQLLPDKLMIGLLIEESASYLKEGESLLLDGFPRTAGQAEALDKTLNVDIVVNLDIPNETIVERLTDRWIHEESGRIYSYGYNPPKVKGKDDETGEPLVQRHDDRPEIVRARLKKYDQSTSPLVQYYEKHGVLKSFSGTQSDVIYPEVKTWLESCLKQ